jgi:uncharacterized ubiquitin-like protein YukD
MQIIVTLKIDENGKKKEFEVQVDQKQRIRSSLEIIFKSFKLQKDLDQIHFIKSLKNKRWVSTNDTFLQGEIYTGDILEIKE